VVDFLTAYLHPDRRIDTHGAVVFLAQHRAYKLKRAVKFPYMDFSTVGLRAQMCRAEIDINRPLAPEAVIDLQGGGHQAIAAVRRCATPTGGPEVGTALFQH
jgi:hypothetical protein